MKRQALWYMAGILTVVGAGCNIFGLAHMGLGPEKDKEHIETERQLGDAGVDVTRDIVQNGVEPGGRNAVVANTLATDLSRSLGSPMKKVDYQNDAEVRMVRGENQRLTSEYKAKEKNYEEKIASMANTAMTMTLGGGGAATIGLGLLTWLWRNRKQVIQAKNEIMVQKEEIEQFAKGGVVGMSQVKAYFEQARIEIRKIAETDPKKALEAAFAVMDRETINPILRTGSEAVGGSKNLDAMLTKFKDSIDQPLLNRTLIDPKVVIHG